MARAIEFNGFHSSDWRARLVRVFLKPITWFSPKYRAFRQWSRALEKAQRARNEGDESAVEKFWREEVTRSGASSNPLDKARALSCLGTELGNQERYSEAEDVLRESQEIARQMEGAAGFWSLGALGHLGMLSWQRGNEPEAEAHFLEALHTAERELGPDHHRVAFELLGLANFYGAHARRADGMAVVERMVTIHEKLAQASPPTQVSEVARFMLSTSMARLAFLYAGAGRDAEAESIYHRVFDLTKKSRGAMQKRMNNSLLAGAVRGYATLLRRNGRAEEAVPYEKQFEKLMKKIDPRGQMPREDFDRMW
jgi:tetratricopeptide (TPR) repeat protein